MKGNQRVALTKRLLQEALLRLLEQKPLDKVSVTALCGESGINRATFYRHYQTPRDVLLDMELNFTEQVSQVFDVKTLAAGTATALEKLCTHLYQHAEIIKIFIQNNSEEDLAVLLNRMFSNFIKRKNDFDVLRDSDDTDLKLISTYIGGGGYFILRQWLTEDIDKTPKEIADMLLAYMSYSATIFQKNT